MAGPRQYPGEQLVERLAARGEQRLRVGVSSAFFARFGLDNPWEFESSGVGWGSSVWRLGGRAGRRGVLGSFQSLFERRMLGHLMGGVLFRGGLGLSLHHPWADWLSFFDRSGVGWMWRERTMAALARLPGSGLRRPSHPWGAYASPSFAFLLPELEELEPEEPTSRRRFRRRPRRARRVDPHMAPLVAGAPPAAPPSDRPAAHRPARISEPPAIAALRRVAAPSTLPASPLVRRAPQQQLPLSPALESVASPVPAVQGMARVLQRQQAPVGTPSMRRALERSAPTASSPFAPPRSSQAQAQPALQGPLAWAETRLQQASDSSAVGRPRPVATPGAPAVGGLPPAARRALAPILFRSPSLSFVAPAPEPDAALVPERTTPARRAARSRARPAHRATPSTPAVAPVTTVAPVAPVAPARRTQVQPEPSVQPAVDAPRILARDPQPSRPRLAPTARLAQRLQTVQQQAPVVADQPYRTLRRASAAQVPDAAASPLMRAVGRTPVAPPVVAQPSRPGDVAAASSLDNLLTRAARTPGLPGRIQAAERSSGTLPFDRGLPAAVVRSARPVSPFRARSPMLAFLDAVEQDAEQGGDPIPTDPRRPRTPSARSPRTTRGAEIQAVERPLRQVASRALLRAEPPAAVSGSVLPRPVARVESDQPLTPLSTTAFPGRRQLGRVQQAASENAAWVAPTTRAMRVPWLPMDRLVESEQPVDPGDEPSGVSAPTRRPSAAPARGGAARRGAAAPQAQAQAQAQRSAQPSAPVLRASARAAARLAEAQPVSPPSRRAAARPPAVGAPAPSRAPSAVAPAVARSVAQRLSTVVPSTVAPAAARTLPGQPTVSAARAAASAALPPAAGPARPTGTQRALHRMSASPMSSPAGDPVVGSVPAASPVFSRQAWASVRAPSTVWLQWREPDQAAADAPVAPRWAGSAPSASRSGVVARGPAVAGAPGAPARAWAPVSSAVAAPIRASRPAPSGPGAPQPGVGRAPVRDWAGPAVRPSYVQPVAGDTPAPAVSRGAPGYGRALPSGRALRRLAARSRVQQRAAAVAGAGPVPFSGPVAPTASLVRPVGPDASVVDDAVALRRSTPATQRARVQRAAARGASSIHVSAIDKLLADGAGAQVLIPALARVDRPDEALRIVLERTLGWRGRGPLPAPVRQLVEQVQEAASDTDAPADRTRQTPDSPRRRSLRRRRPMASRQRHVSAPGAQASATVHHVQANYRIAGLVKKLEQLIHLVDIEHRLAAARSEVRMAEDSPAARSPGSPDASPEAQANQAGQDVDSLVQHIVESVSEEMSLFSMRRPEDPGNRTPWF